MQRSAAPLLVAAAMLTLAAAAAKPARGEPSGDKELIINSMYSDPTAKKAFKAVLEAFSRQHPDIHVTTNIVDHESYKVQIRTWLPNHPPDIATWFAGNRARFFIERGLIEPLDDLWRDIGGQYPPATAAVVRFQDHTYLLPTTYYQWGFYYRKDLFAKAGIAAPPADWRQFLEAVGKLKAIHIQPLTIGTRQGWPAAAWFEFFNLRINGFAFHSRLTGGSESYLGPEVAKVMQQWRELIELGAFPTSAPAMTWQEASALLWQGRAAMYLMGNFISTEIAPELQGRIGFFPFPVIDPAVAPAEVAPVDVYFIPAKAEHKANAKVFLRFLASPGAGQVLNANDHLLPTSTAVPLVNADDFATAGRALLAKATGLTQFFDRDADPGVAKIAMDGFVEFMVYPERLAKVLGKLEKARLRSRQAKGPM